MLQFPGCKINIGLNITEKRPDGFHNLESVFYPLNLTDILEIVKADTYSFSSSGLKIPGEATGNIVHKAYLLMVERYAIDPVNIHLHKQVPMGAGLGGGSGDGAATLLILNDLFQLKISLSTLESMADELGSDCAFFIRNKPAYVTGKGENIQPINIDLSGYYLKLVHPGIHINTKSAFQGMELSEGGLLTKINEVKPESWKDFVRNDFEKTVFTQFPEIGKIKDTLYKKGAIYASMTGTGSTVYGIFKHPLENQLTDYFEWNTSL